jgi:nitroimidazol reductase NimA-like FMN-containing flavoprotein (pyridoxamine 5'-phosphate oxidase superfamily)
MTSASAMAEDACLTALRTERIGRIVLTQRAMPVAVPVSYLVTLDGVVVRVPDDDTSDWHAAGSVVALEADALDVDGGWSVLVLGMAKQVTDTAQIDHFDRTVPMTWADTASSNAYLRIPFSLVSGRRLGPVPVER